MSFADWSNKKKKKEEETKKSNQKSTTQTTNSSNTSSSFSDWSNKTIQDWGFAVVRRRFDFGYLY